MPPAVWIVTVPVATAAADTLSCDGEKLQLAPEGRLPQARLTVPLKLFTGAMLIVACVDEPTETVAAPSDALKPKVGALPAVVVLAMPPKRPFACPTSPAVK